MGFHSSYPASAFRGIDMFIIVKKQEDCNNCHHYIELEMYGFLPYYLCTLLKLEKENSVPDWRCREGGIYVSH